MSVTDTGVTDTAVTGTIVTGTAAATLRRACLGLAAAVAAGLATVPAPASAWPEDDRADPRGARHHRRAGPVARPAAMPPAIVTGYLPRNNGVPMYNEPPRRGPAW